MATGANLQQGRGIQVSNITPQVDLRNGEAEAWAEAGKTLDRVYDTAKPNLTRKARAAGAEEGRALAAGEIERPKRGLLSFGEVAAARETAMRDAYLASVATDVDDREREIRTQFGHDLQAYERTMVGVRSGFIQGSESEFAVDVENYINRRMGVGKADIAENVSRVAIAEADGALRARAAKIESQLRELIDQEKVDTPEYEALNEDLAQAYRQRASNPAIAYSDEEADADYAEFAGRAKATAAAVRVRGILQTEGADAALSAVQEIYDDPSLSPAERILAGNTAREEVNRRLTIENQRRNETESRRNAMERESDRLIDEDIASIELTGSGTDLSADVLRAGGGDAAVSKWLKRRADALELHNLVGNLPLDDPEAAAAQISAAMARRTTLSAMPMVQDAGDLATLRNAIIQVESGGRNGLVSADPDGAGPAGGGAFGVMQVLPDTARRIASKLGLPFDENRLRTDRAYNEQIGTGYLSELVDRYRGDTFLAVTAYHAGEGNVDTWLKSVGDPRSGAISREAWLEGVEGRGNPRSAAYPRKVLAALGAGQSQTAWEAYRGNRDRQAQNPAGSVQTDFAVRTARERWQADDKGVPATEAYVQANLDAQTRARITPGNQRTLPNEVLVTYAGTLSAYERAGDVENFREFSDIIIRRHGKHGQRVMQDILEVRGDSQFAAMVGARALRQAANWQRPATAEVAQASTAARVEQSSRAASGTSRGFDTMSDADLRKAAGLD